MTVDRYPLGTPIRPDESPKPEEWRALDPERPWMQTSTTTGRMRNVPPAPAGINPPPWPWVRNPSP